MIEIITNQQLVTLRRALHNESSRLETELAKWPTGSAEHKNIIDEISVVSGLYSQVENYRAPRATAEAVAMPGTNGGFTTVVFVGKEVPVGTKVVAL